MRLISESDTRQMAGNPCKRTLRNWRADHGFPPPLVLGGKHLFVAEEVEAWIAEKAAARGAAPADTSRGKA